MNDAVTEKTIVVSDGRGTTTFGTRYGVLSQIKIKFPSVGIIDFKITDEDDFIDLERRGVPMEASEGYCETGIKLKVYQETKTLVIANASTDGTYYVKISLDAFKYKDRTFLPVR